MASEINKIIGNKPLECYLLIAKHSANFLKGEESIAFLEKSASIAKEISADEIYLKTQAEIGYLHLYNQKYEKALENIKPWIDWLIKNDTEISLDDMANYLFVIRS